MNAPGLSQIHSPLQAGKTLLVAKGDLRQARNCANHFVVTYAHFYGV
jgi:hypothetical protein